MSEYFISVRYSVTDVMLTLVNITNRVTLARQAIPSDILIKNKEFFQKKLTRMFRMLRNSINVKF